MKPLFSLVFLLSFLACGDKSTDSALSDTGEETIYDQDPFVLSNVLSHPEGCSDFLFFDRNDDDTILLTLQGQDLAQQAYTQTEPLTLEYSLAELPSSISLSVHMGNNLSHALCNDAPDPNIIQTIDQSYVPVNGTITLTITQTGESSGSGDYPSTIDVNIQLADFCADIGNGETHHENCFHVNYTGSAAIGWLPG